MHAGTLQASLWQDKLIKTKKKTIISATNSLNFADSHSRRKERFIKINQRR